MNGTCLIMQDVPTFMQSPFPISAYHRPQLDNHEREYNPYYDYLRGFVYSYHYTVPKDSKPTILFLHGFPSTHQDWAAQINHFSDKGYGVIASDLLGYGDTDAPEDATKYWLVDMILLTYLMTWEWTE